MEMSEKVETKGECMDEQSVWAQFEAMLRKY